jgi:enamine deaminase RidA (YjgF/YER057c/UK114 family)
METSMARDVINPDDMYNAVEYGFSHAVVHGGGKVIECSGQVAWDDDRQLVGAGDLAAQTAQAFRNLGKVLAHVGATPADVVRMRIYVVGHTPDKLQIIGPAIAAFCGDALPPANTLIGVQALALPEFLIEIEASAVLS